jgi:hypothetical protein
VKDTKQDSAAPQPQAPKKSVMTDRLLKLAGLTLAAMSAFFPWYVFLNPDKFGVHVADGDRTRDMSPWPAHTVFSISPLALVNRNEAPPPSVVPDPLTTATVSDVGREEDNGQPALDQPFPGKSSFHLLHVANGRALIEDVSGMYLVRVGSILPDNSKLAKIEQRDGKWVIVTSTGQVYAHD